MVIATQNPIEMEGTYPLPEAQIDRFFFKMKIDYPDRDGLQEIIDKTTRDDPPDLRKVLGADAILEMRSLIKQVPIATHVKDYAIRLVLASHLHSPAATEPVKKYVLYGASPRGVMALVMAGKVSALLDGRYNVALEDIRAVAKPALRHRLVLNIKGETEGVDTDEIIDGLLKSVGDE
jgi:MoxR-like ATPase